MIHVGKHHHRTNQSYVFTIYQYKVLGMAIYYGMHPFNSCTICYGYGQTTSFLNKYSMYAHVRPVGNFVTTFHITMGSVQCGCYMSHCQSTRNAFVRGNRFCPGLSAGRP